MRWIRGGFPRSSRWAWFRMRWYRCRVIRWFPFVLCVGRLWILVTVISRVMTLISLIRMMLRILLSLILNWVRISCRRRSRVMMLRLALNVVRSVCRMNVRCRLVRMISLMMRRLKMLRRLIVRRCLSRCFWLVRCLLIIRLLVRFLMRRLVLRTRLSWLSRNGRGFTRISSRNCRGVWLVARLISRSVVRRFSRIVVGSLIRRRVRRM